MKIFSIIEKKVKEGKKQFAVLIDPDKPSDDELLSLIRESENSNVDYFFVGGSLLTNDFFDRCISILKKNSSIPVVLFPGNTLQMSRKADALLFLSLISGRNAEMLIGRHVIAAPYLKLNKLEVIPTGYMLIDSGKTTTASYMSNSIPIPSDKNDIALCTAVAGEMLGLKLIYMDAGSGAKSTISNKMIESVKNNISVPLIIGGGIRTPEKAKEIAEAGADIVVVGNILEKNSNLIQNISEAVHSLNF